jgi:hypothetical protein
MEDHPVDSRASAAHRRSHLDRVAGQAGVGVLRGRAGQQPARMQVSTEAKKSLPSSVRISVMSPHHFAFGVGAVKSRCSRLGNFGAVRSWRVNPRRAGSYPCAGSELAGGR